MDFRKALCLFICLLALGGCSQAPVESSLAQVVEGLEEKTQTSADEVFSPEESLLAQALEDIKGPLIFMDERFSLYENALAAIGAYIENPGDETLDAAKSACMDTLSGIEALVPRESALTEGERGGLIALGINMADYDALFQYADYHKQANIETLTLLSRYLSQAPSLNDMLGHTVDFNVSLHALDRKLEFIGLNHLLCEQSGEVLETFKSGFLPSLTAFAADGLPWETDKDVLEARVGFLFSEIEDEIDDYAAIIGGQYLDFLEEQAAQ